MRKLVSVSTTPFVLDRPTSVNVSRVMPDDETRERFPNAHASVKADNDFTWDGLSKYRFLITYVALHKCAPSEEEDPVKGNPKELRFLRDCEHAIACMTSVNLFASAKVMDNYWYGHLVLH